MAWEKAIWTSARIGNVFIAFIIIMLLILILKLFKHFQRLSVLDKIPGPKTKFLVGNALDLMGGPTDFIKALSQKFCIYPGGLARVWVMHKPFVFIYGASGVEALLNNSRNLVKSTDYGLLHSWIGLGLLTSSGSKWFARRKILTPAFHFKILEDFIDIFNQQSNVLVRNLQKHANGKKFNIFPFITLATLDIIMETAMGRNVHAQDDPHSVYVNAVHDMGRIFILRFARPWLQYDFIFNMTNLRRMEKKALNVLHTFSMNTIIERKKEYKQLKAQKKTTEEDEIIGKKKRQAFLDLLIEYSEQGQGQSLTDLDIREEVDTFVFEGHDTTSSGISWTIYLLGRHPEQQNKVYEELESIFGDSDRPATSEDIRDMSYLECCIKESLRLLPPVFFFLRNLSEDLTIDGYVVPRGTDAAIFTFNLHRDPEHFPDPLSFQPERFLPENCAKRHPYAFVPFSAGPRNCIGQKFAMMEEKVVLSTFLRKYRVESLEAMEDLRLTGDMILRPEKDLNVKIYPRK